jgi:hypothetical protein
MAPLVAILSACALLMAWYDAQLTGHWWRLPHVEYQEQYTATPQFLWLSPGSAPDSNEPFRRMLSRYEITQYAALHTWAGYLADLSRRSRTFFAFYLGAPGLALLGLGLVPALRRRKVRRALLWLVPVTTGLLSSTWFLSHYAAPGAPLLALLLTQCTRELHSVRVAGVRVGRLALPALGLAVGAGLFSLSHLLTPQGGWSAQRARVLTELEHRGGKHLVMVEYSATHPYAQEWVYNGADLDSEPVLWARALGADKDYRLVRSCSDRQAWVLDADRPEPVLERYHSP